MLTLLKNPASWGLSLAITMQPALFLDRDGVINVDYGYVHRPEEFNFMDGIFDVARTARTQGYRLVVVTNHAGIVRRRYSAKQFHALADWMYLLFCDEQPPIDREYLPPLLSDCRAGRIQAGQYVSQAAARHALPGPARTRDRPGSLDSDRRQAQRRRGGYRCRSRQESLAAGGERGYPSQFRMCADRKAA